MIEIRESPGDDIHQSGIMVQTGRTSYLVTYTICSGETEIKQGRGPVDVTNISLPATSYRNNCTYLVGSKGFFNL